MESATTRPPLPVPSICHTRVPREDVRVGGDSPERKYQRAGAHPTPLRVWLVLFGDDRYCVDLHERAWASVSCGGNDRDSCAVVAHTDRDAAYPTCASTRLTR
jgi:hypothetical protein